MHLFNANRKSQAAMSHHQNIFWQKRRKKNSTTIFDRGIRMYYLVVWLNARYICHGAHKRTGICVHREPCKAKFQRSNKHSTHTHIELYQKQRECENKNARKTLNIKQYNKRNAFSSTDTCHPAHCMRVCMCMYAQAKSSTEQKT